ncbi:MAG: alpha/beta fold hydrolase [Thermodesulfobacteriota bacterium]
MSAASVLALSYAVLSLVLAVLAHRKPRTPVNEPPDWGVCEDTVIAARDGERNGGLLETWRVWPEGEPRGVAVFCHGFTRNRDKMTSRARPFGKTGFITVMASARDHGKSSRLWLPSVRTFAEDIASLIAWAGPPVILYGHSLGAAGAVMAASENPDAVRLLILEGCFLRVRTAQLRLYRAFNPFFGWIFGPGVLFWTEVLQRFRQPLMDPVRNAGKIRCPVLILHGERDDKFPASYAPKLGRAFAPGQARVFIVPDGDHTSAGETETAKNAVAAFVEEMLGKSE